MHINQTNTYARCWFFRPLFLVSLIFWTPVVFGLQAIIVANPQEVSRGWYQWGGPDRNFHAESAVLPTAWPDTGPTRLWSRPLGEGYSSILVDGDSLITMYRDGDNEVVVALDADTGLTRWEHSYHAPLLSDGYFDVWLNSAGPGPYATPLIRGGAVFAVGVNGQLHALDKTTGVVRWRHDLVDLFGLADYNAFASSPVAYGRSVILPLGGSGSGIVAFDRDTGMVMWRSAEFDLGPGSPVIIVVEGEEQLVVWGQQELVGLDPADGRRLWSHPHGNELGLNISMPVWGSDNLLFASSAYDGGSRTIRLTKIDGKTITEEVWHSNRMRVHFGNVLRVGQLVVGSSGDFGPAFMTAVDIETGTEVWRDRSFARAHLVYADGKLVIVDEDGEVAIATITDQGLNIHARSMVLTQNAWTPPTLVDGTLYVRDRSRILALDLGS